MDDTLEPVSLTALLEDELKPMDRILLCICSVLTPLAFYGLTRKIVRA